MRTMETAMNIKEAAAYLKVSPNTIDKLVKEGRLKKFYITEDRPIFYKEDLDAVPRTKKGEAPVAIEAEPECCDTCVCGGCK